MSQINLKSITGITSITTPAGVDNVFTVHSNDTTERFRVDSNGSQVIAGILTVTQDLDVDGHTNLDNVSIAGVTTMSGNLRIESSYPRLHLTDTNHNSDFSIINNDGNFLIYDDTNTTDRFSILANGTVRSHGNFDALGGIDVTGNANVSGDLDVDGHTNLDNTDIVGILTVTSTTQYGGFKLSNNSSIVGELVGLSGSNDTGTLALWSGGSKYIQLSAIGNSYITGGNFGIGDNSPPNFTGYTSLSIHGSTGGALVFGDDGVDEWEIYGGDGVLKVYDRANTSERLRIDSSGRLYLGSNFTGGNGDVDDLVISGTGAKGITLCSTSGGITRFTFADGLSGTAAVIGSIAYEHSVDAMDFYTNALRMMRVDRANSTERLQIGAINNNSTGTRLVLGAGNNIAATAVINTQDANINALTLSNWDGSTTTNKVNMHFDCSGIAGFDVGIPAQTPDFKILNTSGGGGYINMKSTGETKIYRSGVMLADINNSVQGHQFISQSNDNEDGFEVYNQHGSTATRYTFACYDNRSGSKGRSFGVRGDGKTIFYGDALPSADTTHDLGSDSYTWDKFYYKNAYPEQSTEYRITSGTYTNASWHDTAFGRDSMGGLDLNGVYIVTAYADLYQAMGGNYQCNYTWIVGMRNQYTNQTLVNTCPLLSVTGHSTNNFGASGATVGDGIRLGTSRTPASSGGEEQIVWRPAASTGTIDNTAGRTLVFRCQRIGRSSLG